MAKKLSPKELREQQQTARRAKHQAAAAERQKQEKKAQVDKLVASGREPLSTARKSAAKAAGLKSAFVLDERSLLMTTYGRGNAARPEKRITDGAVSDINQEPAFSVEPKPHQYAISGRVAAVSDDPLQFGQGTHTAKRKEMDAEQAVGQSVGFLREKLEEKFYGKTFSDNIHIQLIYNILDIEKLLASHVNHIAYEINNLFRDQLPENEDFIGYMSLNLTYQDILDGNSDSDRDKENNKRTLERFNLLMDIPQRFYFHSAFSDWLYTPENFNAKDRKVQHWNAYYRLCLLGMTRQAMSHNNVSNANNIYKLDAKFDAAFNSNPSRQKARIEARQMLNELYGRRVRELNGKFLEYAGRDLVILFRAYGISGKAQKAEMVRNFYRFAVRKDFKNLGFSVKTLREYLLDCMRERDEKDLRSNDYDPVRRKMYKLVDFVLFNYYLAHPDQQETLVARLRCAMNEVEKAGIYAETALDLYPEVRDVFLDNILPQMEDDKAGNKVGNKVGKIPKEDPDVSIDMLTEQVGEDAHTFSKLIYLLTLYLDGKEINDLLTGLINKLENIQAFQSVLEGEGLCCQLTDHFAMFEESGEIAAELRIINSFARMEQKDGAGAKRIMFIEAAKVLGDFRSEEELGRYFDEVLDQKNRPTLQNGKRDNRFRNFICNNVIDSPRFRYLVRYADPTTVREIIRNRAVVMLVLKDIPDTQITRYYNTCMGVGKAFFPEMRDELAARLADISFLEFENAKSDKDLSEAERKENERNKGIIRLYLTVLYLVVKNLVYVNARYSLAFHCLERDTALVLGTNKVNNQLTIQALEEKRLNRHAAGYMKQNLDNSDNRMIREYRNRIVHLNAIRDAAKYIGDLRQASSYFEVYHYLVQRCLQSKGSESAAVQKYFEALNHYGTYSKDFVKALNTPFGYNLPRYKNLSIDGLFDRNRPGKDDSREAKQS